MKLWGNLQIRKVKKKYIKFQIKYLGNNNSITSRFRPWTNLVYSIRNEK